MRPPDKSLQPNRCALAVPLTRVASLFRRGLSVRPLDTSPQFDHNSQNQMKTPIAVTLIIMGALLVMTPADFLYQRNVVALMSRSGVTSVTLAGQMSELYRFGCWLTGSAMVAVAVFSALFSRRQAHEHARLATQAA